MSAAVAMQTMQTNNAELVLALCADAAQLNALDARDLEADSADAAAVARELVVILNSTIEIFTALEQLNQPAGSNDDLFSDVESDTRVSMRAIKVSPPKLEDVCFAGSLELNRALRDLKSARDLDALRAAAETARRKLGRAIHAVLKVAQETSVVATVGLGGDEQLQRRSQGELESALAVRRLYAEFRRTLRRPESEKSDAVLTALRYAAGALAILTASPHYPAMRVSDRSLLRRQRDRLLDWAHAGKPVSSGLQLLEDIFTCADLLRDINRRQELHAYDRNLIRDLLRDSARNPVEWLKDLERLSGLDDTLDGVIAQAKSAGAGGSGSGNPGLELVMDAVVRLSFLV